jgi:predicted DCC family thiol-disulfide oxidoreductase YuxK
MIIWEVKMKQGKTRTYKEDQPLILFDGLCGFCTASVQWLICRDKQALFRFTAIQSKVGRTHYKKMGFDPENIETFALIKDKNIYVKSNAALEIALTLGGLWRTLILFYLIPHPLRDFFYDLLAKNRRHLVGRLTHCSPPSQAVRERFLE